jgi:hypothetical protein
MQQLVIPACEFSSLLNRDCRRYPPILAWRLSRSTFERPTNSLPGHHRHNLSTAYGKFALGFSQAGKVVGVAVAGRPVCQRLNGVRSDQGRDTACSRCTTGVAFTSPLITGAITSDRSRQACHRPGVPARRQRGCRKFRGCQERRATREKLSTENAGRGVDRRIDRLNPIQENASPGLRKILHFQPFRHSTHSTFYTDSMFASGFLCKLCKRPSAPERVPVCSGNPQRRGGPLAGACTDGGPRPAALVVRWPSPPAGAGTVRWCRLLVLGQRVGLGAKTSRTARVPFRTR